ncbi:hypothetical protein GCM10022222_27910 [Amycolatopsis ultiminotia]|uniref:DUF6923 domain-containing protein n=1 Tax=Amycolatopsis ultiminotia TaxID=543629 RepID=A0ABP6VYK8_9PSEU
MRLVVVAAVAGLLVMSGLPGPPGRRSAAAPASCSVLQVESVGRQASALVRLSLPSGARRPLGTSRFALNAIAYSAGQNVTYGVADGSFPDGSHAVRIDANGRVRDLGAVGRRGHHGGWSWVTGATGGAISGSSWYLLRANSLYTVDIDPHSPDYLTASGPRLLHPWLPASGVDDFAYDPSDGLLYGVSVSPAGRGSVVTLDPATGQVHAVRGRRFPMASAYGSVVFGPDHALYATANRIGYRSVTYRLPAGGQPAEVSTGPALTASDGAGCLTTSRPTPPPTPSPTPTPPRPSSPSPSPVPPLPSSTHPSPPSSASSPAPLPSSKPAASEPSPSSSSPKLRRAAEKRAADKDERVEKQRRWGLAVVLTVVGAGAVAARLRRAR